MMGKGSPWKIVLLSLSLSLAHPLQSPAQPLFRREDDFDPWDLSWIKSYAAIGDSFSAGIGVGDKRPEQDAPNCSRYTGGYPLKVQSAVRAPNFQFVSCSGDVSKEVIDVQLPKLPANDRYDLITVSAGGNDAGFSNILKKCVFLPDTGCDDALKEGERIINEDMQGNIESLLKAIDPKVSDGGVVVWTLYAPFFSLSSTPCNNQKWCFVGNICNSLTVELRTEMNRLTDSLNQKLLDVFTAWNKDRTAKKVYAAQWGAFTSNLQGQFCEADSADSLADASNDKMAFIRPFNLNDKDDLRRRDAEEAEAVEAWKRDTSGPIPDGVLRNFHPNALGTSYQASSALESIVTARLEIRGEPTEDTTCPYTPPPPAQDREDLSCVDPSHSPGAYISVDGMVKWMNDFCDNEVNGRDPGEFSKVYAEDTYDGARMFAKTNHKMSADECKRRMARIIHGCVPAPNNPMNMKYGGELDRDDSHFKIAVSGTRSRNRRTGDGGAPLQAVIAKCDSFWQAARDEFWIYGSGFLSGDKGIELFNQMSHCIGSSVTNWSFTYYDKPDNDGYEWVAFGHTPVFQKNCFSPVIHGSGGPDIPCNGLG